MQCVTNTRAMAELSTQKMGHEQRMNKENKKSLTCMGDAIIVLRFFGILNLDQGSA